VEQFVLTSHQSVLERLRGIFPRARGISDVEALPQASQPAVVWVDAATLTEDVARELVLRVARCGHRAICLSGRPREAEAFAMLAAGASGYCHLLAAGAQLRQIALVVENGGMWLGPDLMRRMVRLSLRTSPATSNTGAMSTLTEREREVSEQVARGASNREIATLLNVSERTVKAHLTAAFAKLGVRDRVQLALAVAQWQ